MDGRGRSVLLVLAVLGMGGPRAAAQEPDSVPAAPPARPIELAPLTVTGTLRPVYQTDAPVRVEVIAGERLARSLSNSLAEAVRHVNGLYPQVECGICYTNSIRINGMAGPYTALLIDGMPIAGALASVYGLSGIDPALIEQLEVVRGPASTLYGSEAMGGVVNVITKDARFAPRSSVHVARADHGQTEFDVAGATTLLGGRTLVSGSGFYQGAFLDDNGDGFSDVPLESRLALFAKSSWHHAGRVRFGVSTRLYGEERTGGVAGYGRRDRGSDDRYGEWIRTRRAEVIATWSPLATVRIDGSWAGHEQRSWYGTTPFDATQHVLFGTVRHDRRLGEHHLMAGLAARWHHYDDLTPATARPERRLVPGVFLEDAWEPNGRLTVLAGVRADHHAAHGVIVSPRGAVKLLFGEHTTVRASAGTGFRVVNLFTEDHAALTGAREVIIEEALEPERSRSVALNLNQVIEIGISPLVLDLDLFDTRFSNRIVADYARDPDAIVYENLGGGARTRGVSLSANQNVGYERLLWQLGVTFQQVTLVRDEVSEREPFAPEWIGVFGLTYRHPSPALSLDWSGAVTGPMRLIEYPAPHARAVESPVYWLHDVTARWQIGAGWEAYVGARNLFDRTQGSPLIAADAPFSDSFDTTYVWGPIEGRRVIVGARWMRARADVQS